MAYQETTTTSYGQRVSSSCGGIITGIVLFFAGTALLWWNEGRAVKTDKMLNEAQGVTVEMPDVNKVNPEFEGKLVHATALATTEDSLSDGSFGIGAKAISIERKVEYYQYVEHSESKSRDKIGGGQETVTTYTYKMEWTSKPVNSQEFHDPTYQNKNFVVCQHEDARQYAQNVSFGAYKLTEGQIHSISGIQPFVPTFTDEQMKRWNTETAQKIRTMGTNTAITTSSLADTAPATANDSTATASVSRDYDYVHLRDNVLYYGANPSSPQLGDVRVTFTKVMPAQVTIIATVTGNTFKPFKAENGKTFSTLVMGQKSVDEIYQSEHDTNSMMLWLLRIVGIAIVIGGLKTTFGIFETLMKILPFLANIVGFGVGLICTIVGTVWSLLVIAIAWIAYRPVLGITILVVAGGILGFFVYRGRQKKLQQPQPAQQPGQAPNYQGLYDQYKNNNQNLNGQNPGQPGQR